MDWKIPIITFDVSKSSDSKLNGLSVKLSALNKEFKIRPLIRYRIDYSTLNQDLIGLIVISSNQPLLI